MTTLALDLGRFNRQTHGTYQDPATGKTKRIRFRTNAQELKAVIERHQVTRLVFEICPSAGMVCDLARPMGVTCVVANTNEDAFRWKNRKSKTDQKDAEKLRKIDQIGDIHPVHVPDIQTRDHRALCHARERLVSKQTQVKNEIRALLESHWQEYPDKHDLWSRNGIAWLTELSAMPGNKLAAGEMWRKTLARDLALLKFLAEQINEATEDLDEIATKKPVISRLDAVPGFGPRTAESYVAVMDDPTRFRTDKQVSAYFGLVPRVYQSGDGERHGRITKAGNRRVRALLIEAAWTAVRHSQEYKALFERISGGHKGRRKIAIVAVARRLAVTAWAMMKNETTYQPRKAEATISVG
jgi:transposase